MSLLLLCAKPNQCLLSNVLFKIPDPFSFNRTLKYYLQSLNSTASFTSLQCVAVTGREAVSLSERRLLSGQGLDGRRCVAVFGSDPGHVFQLTRVGYVVARLVLGQDFHQRTQFEPPLLLWDPVAERTQTVPVYIWKCIVSTKLFPERSWNLRHWFLSSLYKR